MKDKLDICVQIHKATKIQPDMWYDKIDGELLFNGYVQAELNSSAYGENPILLPYYPLEQVFRELPKTIEKKNYCTAEARPDLIEPYPDVIGIAESWAVAWTKEEWDEEQKVWYAAKYEDIVFHLNKNEMNYTYYDNMGSIGNLFKHEVYSCDHLAGLELWLKVIREG